LARTSMSAINSASSPARLQASGPAHQQPAAKLLLG
jgi:hypothetical protein